MAEWVKDSITKVLLKNTIYLNWIAQSMIITQNDIILAAGVNNISLELPSTYMTVFDGTAGNFKIMNYATIDLIKGFKESCKFLSKI